MLDQSQEPSVPAAPTGTPPFPKSCLGLRSQDPGGLSPLSTGHSQAARWLMLAVGSCSGLWELPLRSKFLIHYEVLCVPVIPVLSTYGLGMSYRILTDRRLDLKCTLAFLDHHP